LLTFILRETELNTDLSRQAALGKYVVRNIQP
jgi:hypothetical protein